MKTPQKPISGLNDFLQSKYEVWFKFENKHHYGSHKGRSIPPMIDEYVKNNKKSFVISSSGNAALAAERYVNSHNKNKPTNQIALKILVGKSIEQSKFKILKEEQGPGIAIEQAINPKQSAVQISTNPEIIWLRSSTDDLALTGYTSLAEELSKIPNLSAVFLASSSGTSAEGLWLGFQRLGLSPEMHIVQTDYCHPLVNLFLEKTGQKTIPDNANRSIADAIIDKVGRRKESVLKALLESKGQAWIVNDEQIKAATDIASTASNEEISPNGALCLAGLKKAAENGITWSGPVVCIIGGP